ncbi:hypothetical protein [Aliiruegeria lutimaris]|uniref:ATP-binding protein n=1 Tax=Aliiruegeria lutimaris TaxID=571298 RepID=A0A1G9PLJ9_9RHOB|nr:hypothetical protein [Aliiruegeria lutimaris]SDL99443.1 hypothetical protein SAMN04488026_11442 [Aliiruegeria lutimaris]
MISAREFFDLEAHSITSKLEADFYGSLKMKNASFKTTNLGRFRELDDEIVPLLAEKFSGPLPILDVGVSAGVSTLEMLDSLKFAGLSPTIIATDLYLLGHLVELSERMTVLTDRHGWPLQYEYSGRTIRPWIRRLDYFTLTAPIRIILARILARRCNERIAQGESRPVTLASRIAIEAPEIALFEDDVMALRSDFHRTFKFIRAANILNLNYFSEDRLRLAVRNLRYYLAEPGALLLVVRTNKKTGQNDGTLFELTENGNLVARQTFGAGSEISEIVATIEASENVVQDSSADDAHMQRV